MPGADLQQQLEQRLRRFYRTFFERGAENRFSDLVERGHEAYPELLAALAEEDDGERVDALVSLGRIFESHGHTDEALEAVVAHAKGIREGGMGPERQAALFALGRSREPSLMESFLPLLGQEDPNLVNIALMVLGYARWSEAAPFIRFIVDRNHRDTIHSAIWALGQLGREEALELLLPMLRRGENLEWLTGALGDIGSPEALEDLAGLLDNPRPDIRFLAMAAISAIVDQNRDRKVRRQWVWLYPSLRAATGDAFPPVAVFACLALAELGQPLAPDRVTELFELDHQGPALTARETLLARRPID